MSYPVRDVSLDFIICLVMEDTNIVAVGIAILIVHPAPVGVQHHCTFLLRASGGRA